MHKLWLTLASVCVLSGCVSAGIGESSVREANRTPPRAAAQSLPAAAVIGSTDYRLGPLDALYVDVFQQTDLTREVKVSASGEIALPLVGRILAAGKTTEELETVIRESLAAAYLENPKVTVTVREYLSQRVTMEGALSSPGIYPLTGRTSLLQMIATAHGLDELANPGAVVVYRQFEGKRYAAAFDIREIRVGRMIDPEVLGGDIVVVDYSGARATMRDFMTAYPMFQIFKQF